KAALALRDMAGVSRGARITLDKRIPVAAGLGGGSTDAAAVLVGLNRVWGLGWSTARLADAAVKLGMDVPFFLHGGAALATGRGDRLAPLTCSALSLVLVNPGVAASTAEIYGGVVATMYSDGARALGMLGGPGAARPGDPHALRPMVVRAAGLGPCRPRARRQRVKRTRWGVAKRQGAGLWIPYSEVRILPPQPHE